MIEWRGTMEEWLRDGRAVVRRNPDVGAVAIFDRFPICGDDGRYRWLIERMAYAGRDRQPAIIPGVMWAEIASDPASPLDVAFATHEEAGYALSRACLAHAWAEEAA